MRILAKLIFLILFVEIHGISICQYNFNVKQSFSETNHKIFHASFSSNGKYIITIGSDSSVIIWNADKGIIYRTLTGLKKRPNAAVISPDNKYLYSAGKDDLVSMWDISTRAIVKSFVGHHDQIKSIDISPDGRTLASGSADKSVRIWNLQTQDLLYELKGHSNDVNAVAYSPDGQILASGGADKTLILWSVSDGRMLGSIAAHKGWIRDIVFSPDGSLLATCSDDRLINVWKIPGLTKVATLEGHKDWVQCIDFSPDGKSIISGGHDQVIILWDVNSGKILHKSEKLEQIVLSVDFNPLKPDFLSACLHSEGLNIWAVSGLDLAQWKNKSERPAGGIVDQSGQAKSLLNENSAMQNISTISKSAVPLIDLFSPVPKHDSISSDKDQILFVGRINDVNGIKAFFINNKQIKLTEGGIFQYPIYLQKGINQVSLIAITNDGKQDERMVYVSTTADLTSNNTSIVPDIEKSKFYALLIGINNYKDQAISHLENPLKDVEKLGHVLQSNYTFEKENILSLRDPTRAEIMMALDELSKKLTVNDNLLIFYAGHGYWNEKGNVGYWFPSDAARNNTVDWLPNSQLRDFIGSLETRHTLLIADACFSGAIFKTRSAFSDATPIGIQKLYELPSRKAMTSGILELVPDKSVFLEYLLKRLEENKEKFLSSEVLFSSFKTVVMNNSGTIPQFGTIQNVGDEGGDFIFIKR